MPYDVNALTAQLQTVTTRNWKSRQEAAYRLGCRATCSGSCN